MMLTRVAPAPSLSFMPGGGFPTAPLARFNPSKIAMFRDGGTIKVEGMINRSQKAAIRFDGALSSRTRGQLYVAYGPWNGNLSAERPMLPVEMRALLTSLRLEIRTTTDTRDAALYRQLATHLRSALKGTAPKAGAQA